MPKPITEQIISDLFSNDDIARSAAAAELGVSDPLQLEPEDYLIEIACRLGDIKASPALPRLQTLLAHPDVLVRASAAGAVAKIDPALGLPILETLLEEDDREVRSLVIGNLCATDAPEVIRILSRILLGLYHDRNGIDPSDDWTRDLRGRMARTLGWEGDPYALPSLMHASRDGDPQIRADAISALGKINDVESLPVVLRALEDRDGTVRRRAANALSALGDPSAADALLRTLDDPDPKVVVAAVHALAQLGDRRAGPEFLRIMGGESDRVARAVAKVLPRLDPDITVPTLIDRLTAPDTDTETKANAAAALGMMGYGEAGPRLVTALGSPAIPVRIAAARALGRLRYGFAVPYLADVLEGDPPAEVLRVTAQALGELGNPSFASALEAAKQSPNPKARQAAQLALIRLGRAQIVPEAPPDSSQRSRHRAPRLLMKRGSFDQRI